jgi:hypothetical protein
MNIHTSIKNRRAQTAVEYLLLLTTVAAIVLIGLKTYLPSIRETSNIYYNRATPAILGDPPKCGDGCCSDVERLDRVDGLTRCPIDCPGPVC